MDYTHHCVTPLGPITLAADGIGLIGLWFDGQKHFAETLGQEHVSASLPVFGEAERWLEVYFSGSAPDCTPRLSMRASPFRRAVWEILLTVPYGQTVTYGQIAERMGLSSRSARAVGAAVGHNAISLIIPCHRVLGADGSLTGYAGGVFRKRMLLQLEGVRLRGSAALETGPEKTRSGP
ncbi:MAG: methylated-DNA--[Clostridia bacterium]|nr:methylated-DNA--[protein]-cysteine S-methyltransferase [Clostridia bacterium]